jgi:putative DNA primase/helicase
MNQLPSLPEDNLAIWRRLMLIDFPNQFTGTDADKNLLAKLTTEEELSGLLNLALQHLKDVQTKGEFSYFRTIDEVRREYLLKTDPALVFIKERCNEVSDSYISKEDMYQAFVSFCQELKRPAPGKNQFGARLKSFDIVSERQDGWGIHEWVGLKLK